MPESPETRHSLLLRVQRDERDAWSEFAQIYRPMIYRIVRRRGWQDADAQDVAQKVLVKVSDAISSFETNQQRARFRTWLTTICNNAMVDEIRRRRPDAAEGGFAQNMLSVTSQITEDEVQLEHHRQVFRWAAAKAKDTFQKATWLAFWLTAVETRNVRDVAKELQISAGAVYTARSRVMRFLKQKVQEFDDEV